VVISAVLCAIDRGTVPRWSYRRVPVIHDARSQMMNDSTDGQAAAVTAGHPTVAAYHQARAASVQLRVADAITAFAGSMPFVYVHVVAFALWMVFAEQSPWPTLTLVVSLEAIFLSTFVMVGQNRQSEFQRAKADHDFVEQELELKTNTELTRAIHVLTTELHRRIIDDAEGGEKTPT
jgi:uncharacterized membrane protein